MISQKSFLDAYDQSTEEKLGSDSKTTDEDENNEEDDISWPSAPPVDYIDTVKGYELVSFDAMNVPPPPVIQSTTEEDEEAPKEPPPPPPVINLDIESKITEEQAQGALLSYLANHCCYGKGAAKGMVIKSMEYLPAYHYELQTFCEKRETAWTYSPLRSGLAESHSYGGVPPLPWEIEEYPTQAFKDEVKLLAVPNTVSIKTCHRCRGTGGMLCRDCNGKGWARCINCHGDGWLSDSNGLRERCFYCQHSKHGHGQQDCQKCHTKGKVNCGTCDGQGQIKCYIQLSITWKVHTAEHIVEKLNLPHELIRDVSGQVAFEEEQTKLMPLGKTIPNKDIQDASASLVNKHENSYADQKIVAQRHQVRIVPITKVAYEWKSKQHFFFVYGYENKVYLEKYPQRCCWGCNIL